MFDFETPLKLADVVIVIATFLSPFFAVQASEYLRGKGRAHEAREQVFHTLMGTRTARMAPAHVMALNRIDLVFAGKRFEKVRDAWAFYLAHLTTERGATPEQIAIWEKTSNDRFYPLLRSMATAMNADFTDAALQHNAYYPMGYVFTESQQNEMRAAALQVLKGEKSISIRADLGQAG